MKRLIYIFALALISFSASAQAFSTTLDTEKKPWTGIPQIKGDDYKFIVLPDKTGGDEIGVFEQAIEDINRLAPDFVINVGDLIGGYFTDVKYCERDWNDILGRLKALDAPFFLVGGNHDLTNQLQTEDFKSRFGATYYSFSIGPDLFLVLDSEEHSGRSVSDAQVEYFRGILNGWNGRHIYVFMHSPMWAPQNHDGYEYIAEMLKGHQYTVFSGHTHQYYYENRDGMDHFILATAGGDSERRGQLMGEYDHLMLVSAREGKPAIANIPIGSLVPNDIVDRNTMPMVMWMASGRYVSVPYTMLDCQAPAEFELELAVKNSNKDKMSFGVTFPEGTGLEFSQPHIEGVIAPESDKAYKVTVKNPAGVEPGKINAAINCAYTLKGKEQAVDGKLKILTDYVRHITKGEKLTMVSKDHYDISESWDWHGIDDGWFDFDVEIVGKNLVVTVRTHDDIRALDKVTVCLETGSMKYEQSFEPESAIFKLPLKNIKDGRFLLNVFFTDNDDPEEGDPSVLRWRPGSNPGQFIIDK